MAPWHFKSFFRQPGLAQAIDDNRQSRYRLRKKFDRELRIETTRLRQSELRLGVIPFRSLGTRQKGVSIIGRVPRYDGTLKLLDCRVEPIGIRQRERLNASRKTGLVSTVSARALNVAIRSSLSGLFHHHGTGPQRMATSWRSAVTTSTGSVGQTL